MNEQIHYPNWTPALKKSFADARTIGEKCKIALEVLGQFPGELHMVSGPISTGGLGSIKDNILVLTNTIESLYVDESLNIFSQIPFIDGLLAFKQHWMIEHPQEAYCWPIAFEFYWPLLSSGRFKCVHFIHGWKSSTGSRWEHMICDRLMIKERFLTKEFFYGMRDRESMVV